MKKLIPTLLMIPICALRIGVACSADAPADSDEPATIVTAPSLPEEKSDTHLSLTGLGSIYWAARHPAQAWRVLLPVQPGDEFDAFADVSARCVVFAGSPGEAAGC